MKTLIVSIILANGKGTKWKMGRPNNLAGCTKFGKLINGQGTIRAGRVSNFSEMNKWACPFIRQVRVVQLSMHLKGDIFRSLNPFFKSMKAYL